MWEDEGAACILQSRIIPRAVPLPGWRARLPGWGQAPPHPSCVSDGPPAEAERACGRQRAGSDRASCGEERGWDEAGEEVRSSAQMNASGQGEYLCWWPLEQVVY